jgi:outer membrane receptor for monomeric catechols
MQRFVDQLVFLNDAISLEIRAFNQCELDAHGGTSEGNNQGYTPEGSGVPEVGVKLQALADGASFTAE